MKYTAISPMGEDRMVIEIVNSKVKICRSPSPEVCQDIDAVVARVILERKWHKGWRVHVER